MAARCCALFGVGVVLLLCASLSCASRFLQDGEKHADDWKTSGKDARGVSSVRVADQGIGIGEGYGSGQGYGWGEGYGIGEGISSGPYGGGGQGMGEGIGQGGGGQGMGEGIGQGGGGEGMGEGIGQGVGGQGMGEGIGQGVGGQSMGEGIGQGGGGQGMGEGVGVGKGGYISGFPGWAGGGGGGGGGGGSGNMPGGGGYPSAACCTCGMNNFPIPFFRGPFPNLGYYQQGAKGDASVTKTRHMDMVMPPMASEMMIPAHSNNAVGDDELHM